MQKATGSGAATNAGIDYQQRVSAWFLMGLLLDTELPIGVEELKEQKIKEMLFESNNPIDDLNILFSNNISLYAQIKRSIDFSTNPDSDFYKTLHQFIYQFSVNPINYFALITSPRASSKVTETFNKILESIRLNNNNFEANPLTKPEKDILKKYTDTLSTIFKEITSNELSEEVFLQISKRIYIIKLDIENDAPHEQAAIMALSQKSNVNPYLVWNALITGCLHFAKNRLSINREGCILRYGKFLKGEDTNSKQLDINSENVIYTDDISCGKEVLFISGEIFGKEYAVVELFRFEDDCSKRSSFKSPDRFFFSNGEEAKLIFRSATFAGLERFLSTNETLYKDKDTIIIPANDIDNVDETPCAKLYKEYCDGLVSKNKTPHLCIHCEKPVSEPESILIEIDDLETPPVIGTSHMECRRPVDRVLGIVKNEFFAEYPFLKNFNVSVWSELITNGQFIFRQLKHGVMSKRSIHNVVWTPDDEKEEESDYCIKINLSDGSFDYVTTRAKVEKFSKAKAEKQVKDFNLAFQKSKKMNDPWGYTSKNRAFGLRSILMKSKELDENFVECISAEVTRYNKSIGALYDKTKGFYTPVCFLVNRVNEEPIFIHGFIVLITEPLKLNYYIKNWQEANIYIDQDYELRTIKQDADFDIKARQFTSLGYALVADPILDTEQNIISGVIILSEEQVKQQKNQ